MLLVFAAIQIITWLAPSLYVAKGIANYAPLHTLLEFIAIVISILVFAVVWSAYDKECPRNFMVLASIFVGVAILDFLHTISYQGMPDFITPSGPEKAIYFWLAARALSAFGLLAIAFLPWRQKSSVMARWLTLSGVLLLVGILSWIGLLHLEWMPRTIIPVQGLTTFKVMGEYSLVAVYIIAGLRFLHQMHAPQCYDVVGLFAAVCVMALSELFFTLYADVTDIFNLLGHIYKDIAYGFIYNSVFISSIRAPYQRMHESKNILQAVIEAIPVRVFWKDRESRYLGCNTLFATDAGEASPENVVGKYDVQLAWREQAELYRSDDRQVMDSASSKLVYEEPQTSGSGKRIWLRTSKVPLHNVANEVIGVLGTYEDITKQKQDEHELRLTQTAIDKSKSAFYRLNPEGAVLYSNDHACQGLGYSRDELIGKYVWEFDPDFPPDAWSPMWAGIKKTGLFNIETRHRRKDGTVFPVEVIGNYIVSEGEEYSFTFVQDITERKRIERDLHLTHTAINKSRNAFFWLTPQGQVNYANDYACQNLGYSCEELTGLYIWDFDPDFPPEAQPKAWEEQKKKGMISLETRHRRKDGTIFPVEVIANYIATEGEEHSFVFVQDITERKQAEQTQIRLTRSLKLLSKCNALLIHAESEQEILTNICKLAVEMGGYVMAWVGFAENDAAKTVLPVAQSGYEEGYLDNVNITWADTERGRGPTGTAIRTGVTAINQNVLTNPNMAPWREAAIKRGYQSSIALPLIIKNRVLGALTLHSSDHEAFEKKEVGLLEELASDLAYGIQTLRTRVEHEAAEKKLEFLAHHDPLTGLPNRLLLRDRFDQAMAIANRERADVAVLFLDLDNFKHVNDSLGHVIGDQLLIRVSERIQECIRETDTISRQGGDEFIILLTNIQSLTTINAVAQKIVDAFVAPFYIDNHVLFASASIGISIFPDDGEDFDELLKQADTVLYQAKDAGKNTYRFFSEKINIDAVENMRLQSQLHNAIKNQELLLHYQPQIDMVSGRIIGAEALVRWQHPGLGFVPPAKFIPLAERSGLIIPIGEWVLNEACRQAQVWRETCVLSSMVIAVNLSALQFKRGNIVETVTNALTQSGLPASQLELELTESILLHDVDVVIKTLHRLKEIGVKLSIDDFGTGYSSLSYLKKLAVDKLKIDQSFVRDMVKDSDDAAIVKAIIQLGHTLQLTVIAEGVENEGQLAILKNYGCDEIQGYLLSRPIPAREFSIFINNECPQ